MVCGRIYDRPDCRLQRGRPAWKQSPYVCSWHNSERNASPSLPPDTIKIIPSTHYCLSQVQPQFWAAKLNYCSPHTGNCSRLWIGGRGLRSPASLALRLRPIGLALRSSSQPTVTAKLDSDKFGNPAVDQTGWLD